MIDFSYKHNYYLWNEEDGTCIPMDEPYFRAEKAAEGIWQILSDGDFSYLVEGNDEAVVIDSGYGAGNIREFCQTLTEKPVRNIINTHDHFDHTANNCYFECAYMTEESVEQATIPFPSFEGIVFPRDYPIQILEDGGWYPLKGRELQVFKLPDHSEGSICILDRKARVLFTGDEFFPWGKALKGSVQRWARNLEKLMAYRRYFDRLLCGARTINADFVDRYLANAHHILEGHEGGPVTPMKFEEYIRTDEEGHIIWKRRDPHPGDGPKNPPDNHAYRRQMVWADCSITYDIRRVLEHPFSDNEGMR